MTCLDKFVQKGKGREQLPAVSLAEYAAEGAQSIYVDEHRLNCVCAAHPLSSTLRGWGQPDWPRRPLAA